MKFLLSVVFFIFSLNFSSNSFAYCSCECVNGQVQALCSSSLDIKPICAPRICPIVNPSIKPFDPIKIPPIGTQTCTNMQVYNQYTYTYEWEEICY